MGSGEHVFGCVLLVGLGLLIGFVSGVTGECLSQPIKKFLDAYLQLRVQKMKDSYNRECMIEKEMSAGK